MKVENSIGAHSSLTSTSHSCTPACSVLAVPGSAQCPGGLCLPSLCSVSHQPKETVPELFAVLAPSAQIMIPVPQLLPAVGKHKHTVQGHPCCCQSQGDLAARLVAAFAQSTKTVPMGGRDRVRPCRCWSETKILDTVCFIWDSLCCCWPMDQLCSCSHSADPASSSDSCASPSSQTRGAELN